MAVLMPSAKAPCKDCTKRTAGCWSTCEEYIAFRKARYELTSKIKKAVRDEKDASNYIREQQFKALRRKIAER